jgi:hypothetical protein
MADYQSLLTRAVANLASASTPASRQAIYDRARKALVTQLRTLRPPLPESDIAREEGALDKAIAMVEAQFASPTAAQEAIQEATAPTGPAASASPAAPSASAAGGHPATPPPSAPKPGQPARTPQPPPNSQASAAAAAPVAPVHFTPARPAAPPSTRNVPQQQPSAPDAKPAARPTYPQPPSNRPATTQAAQAQPARAPSKPNDPPVSGAVSPPAAPRVSSPKPPPVRVAPPSGSPPGGNASAAPPVVAAKTEGASAPANLAKVVPTAGGDAATASSAPAVVASRADGAAQAAELFEKTVGADRAVSAARLDSEGQRPVVPAAPVVEKGKSWVWLALAAVVGVVLSVAVAAILMRQKPQDLAITPPAEPQQEAPQPPAKIAQRAQPSPAEEKSPPAATGQQTGQQTAQPSAPAGQEAASPPAEAQNAAGLPSAARAAMLIASPDNPQKPVVNLGSTVWSTIPPAPGQPATVGVKAEADIPDLKMHATMTLRKNTDSTLQATHTIDLKFAFADGAPITGFKDVGLPQMRKLDSTASEQLTSVKVKISDVYFLIALAKGDEDVVRNLDLMRTRAWFDFPLLLNDNRIAKLVFQKSADGEAMLEKAFEAWK